MTEIDSGTVKVVDVATMTEAWTLDAKGAYGYRSGKLLGPRRLMTTPRRLDVIQALR